MADNKSYQDRINLLNILVQQEKELTNLISSSTNAMDRAKHIQELINTRKILSNEQNRIEYEIKNKTLKLNKEQKKELNGILNKQNNVNKQLKNENSLRGRIINNIRHGNSLIKNAAIFLLEQDKTIKSTILNLGLSNTKADLLRQTFEQSAGHAARLGGSLVDVQTIITGYADETGRARVLSSQMVEDVMNIGKGTGLGVEAATRLGAQFELMGLDARATNQFVQGIVDTTERMGVNTTKVLKNVNNNFKRLNTYTFQQGVRGIAEMASYAEKFKIDINQALNAADIARSLEGAIGLAANLQIMGGEFAKTDPFEMLFLSRNDPAKFTEKISEMTRGVITFRKTADGAFEKFISPADRDRLANVAKSLNMSVEDITQIAQRRAEMDKMAGSLMGMGLSDREKELIKGAAIFESKSGKFQVQIGQHLRNISELTSEQAQSFAKEQVLLSERAKEAMTFDEAFKATINEIKLTLLPLLRTLNKGLAMIRPTVEIAVDKLGPIGAGTGLIAAAFLWKPIVGYLGKSITTLLGISKILKSTNVIGNTGFNDIIRTKSGKPNIGATNAYNVGQANRAKAMSGMHKAKGLKGLGRGVGIGAAGLGVGAGMAMGFKGMSNFAEAVKDMDDEKLKRINHTMIIMGGTMAVLGAVGAVAGKGLAIAGAGILGIGAGIGVAAAGIGYMAEKLGNMADKSKDAGPAMLEMGKGIGAMSVAMLGFQAGLGGMAAFRLLIGSIAKRADDLDRVGNAFKQINAVMSGSKDDFTHVQKAVESISNLNMKEGGMIAELTKLLKTPLKVEFADKNVQIANNITLEIDGEKIFNKTLNVNTMVQRAVSEQIGKPD